MSDCVSEERVRFGVLFVPGFREQRPGRAIASFASALYGWFFYWDTRPDPQESGLPAQCEDVLPSGEGKGNQPGLRNAALSGVEGVDQPAHLTLSFPLRPGTCDRAYWLLAESSWADLFTEPQFLGLARWIWKVSTCLLVLQFVTPMRRHWNAASLKDRYSRGWAAELALAGVFVVLMGVAAMLSVLQAALLLVVALAAYLPIPRIDEAVRWTVVHISAMLGDSYMLAHCPVQFAAMRSQVARDLAWLQDRCERVAVVAHSQGAVLVHRVLKDDDYRHSSLKGFITLGQGITKFDLLWRLDWDPQVRWKAHRSRVLVTCGMACAGLPAVGLVIGHWVHDRLFKALTSLPWWLVLLIVGFACIAWGVRQAMDAVCHKVETDLGLPDTGFTWSDYYASADPVSNGPLAPNTAGDQLLPNPCNEVYNSGSVTFDHNGYLRNQDELLPSLLNDLVAAAYGRAANPGDRPELVRQCDVKASSQRRHRLLRWLIAARITAIILFSALVWSDPGRGLKHPMTHLMHLFAAPTGISSDPSVRVLFAALVTAAFYIAAVMAWQAALRRSVRLFFRDTQFSNLQTWPDDDASTNQTAMSGLSGADT